MYGGNKEIKKQIKSGNTGLNRETNVLGKTTFTTTLHIIFCPLLAFNIFALFLKTAKIPP
jgi:hypothetical protein